MKHYLALLSYFFAFLMLTFPVLAVPTVTLSSPTNSTYGNGSVDLNWTVSGDVNLTWVGYSLNGLANVTLFEHYEGYTSRSMTSCWYTFAGSGLTTMFDGNWTLSGGSSDHYWCDLDGCGPCTADVYYDVDYLHSFGVRVAPYLPGNPPDFWLYLYNYDTSSYDIVGSYTNTYSFKNLTFSSFGSEYVDDNSAIVRYYLNTTGGAGEAGIGEECLIINNTHYPLYPQQINNKLEVFSQDAAGFNVTTVYFTTDLPGDGGIYYNDLLLSSNVSADVGNATVCRYAFNDVTNVSWTCRAFFNETLNINLEENNLTLYWTNTTGSFYKEIIFNGSIKCSSTEDGDTTCGSSDLSYVISCGQIGDDKYQFDYDNMTYCEYGCAGGECINRSYCTDNCKENETMCNRGHIINCEEKSTGCWDWTGENQTFCKYGCLKGACLNCTDFCSMGDGKCVNNEIIHWCDDDDRDGCLDYSNANTTYCEFGCAEDLDTDTGRLTVECNYHSFDEIYGIKNVLDYWGFGMNYVFDTLNLRVWISLILVLVVSGFIGFKMNWRTGLGIMAVGMGIFSWYGWVPWVTTIVFYLFVGGVLFVQKSHD